jgi:hypothetical protein
MSASNLSKPLFHGTTANLKEGDILKSDPKQGNLVYSTEDYKEAQRYANVSMHRANAMIGSIYEVEPLEGDTTITKQRSAIGDQRKVPVRVSEKGFRVKRHVGWA